jgi:hypothetical protein
MPQIPKMEADSFKHVFQFTGMAFAPLFSGRERP